METNWYININNENYGPYTWEQMYNMTKTQQLVPTNLVYHESLGKWVPASEIKELWPMPNSTPVTIAKPKKKKGCLFTFLIGLTLFSIIILLIGLFLVRPLFNDDKLSLGKNKVLLSQSIDSTGGKIIVDDNKSEIDGLIIDIPEGSYKDVDFEVSTKEIKDHDFGDYITPITPLIVVKNGGDYSEEIMTVTIPIDISEDEFAMAFYYTDENELEAIPLIALSNEEIIIATRHFSGLLVSSIKKVILEDITYDTEFRPGTDDWSFENQGSHIAPSGYCVGASTSMAYYYYEHGRYGETPLHELLDNNHGTFTPSFQQDDSLGIRLASTIQKEYTNRNLFNQLRYTYVHRNKELEDEFIHMAIGYAMIVTEEPQIMGIFVRDDSGDKPTIKYGHAIVAYAISEEGIYISDPNLPGNQDMYIPYSNGKFGIYNTSTSVFTSKYNYNSFSLIAKTAIIDWNRIGELFKEAELSADKSTVGDEYFPFAKFNLLLPQESSFDWILKPFVSEIDPEDASVYKATIKLNVEALNSAGPSFISLPEDFDSKAYAFMSVYTGYSPGGIEIYEGLNNKPFYDYVCGDNLYNYVFLPLENGMNNFGIYYTSERRTSQGSHYDFIDFERISIYYGEEDLTGTWDGSFTITNYEAALDYATDLSYKITEGLITILAGFVNPDITDAEIDEIVESSIEVNEDIDKPMPISLVISNKIDNHYDVRVTIETDSVYTFETKAEFINGELIFDVTYSDGSVWHYVYGLDNARDLVGEFSVDVGIDNFISGISNVHKED